MRQRLIFLGLFVIVSLSPLTEARQPAGHLPGRVVFDATTLAPPADLTRLRIYIWKTTDDELRTRIDVGTAPDTLPPAARVGDDGTFDLTGLPPGTYSVRIRATRVPAGWWLRSAMVNGKDALDSPLEIRADGMPGELVLTFSDRRTTLSGSVHPPADRAASAYTVVVFPVDRSQRHAKSRRVATVAVNGDGQFLVRDLPPGDYLIAATAAFKADDILDPAFFERLSASATRLTLADGETKAHDIRISGSL